MLTFAVQARTAEEIKEAFTTERGAAGPTVIRSQSRFNFGRRCPPQPISTPKSRLVTILSADIGRFVRTTSFEELRAKVLSTRGRALRSSIRPT
jgi:hypothetical protein